MVDNFPSRRPKRPIEMSWIGRNGRWVYRRICQISPVEIVYKCLYRSYLVWWNFIGLRLSEIPNQSGCYKVYHSDCRWSFHTRILSLGLSLLTMYWYDGTKSPKYVATTGHYRLTTILLCTYIVILTWILHITCDIVQILQHIQRQTIVSENGGVLRIKSYLNYQM